MFVPRFELFHLFNEGLQIDFLPDKVDVVDFNCQQGSLVVLKEVGVVGIGQVGEEGAFELVV